MKISKFPHHTLLAGLLILPAAKEHPYLDPGSGSFILQMLIAGAAGAVFILRNQIARFFGLFRRDGKTERKAGSKAAKKRNAK
ncbi:MAG TPA: hypothetical protein VI703_05825 [Anaerolineales bacterium]|jgi:hypothetical protein|nr:hypothetical protein [Anaerolineales bacterium]